MDMLFSSDIANASLTDWHQLAQGLHARFLVADFRTAANFISAIADEESGHFPKVSLGDGYVDLKLISVDAIYHENETTDHIVEWVTQKDIEAARLISAIAARHGLSADPDAVSVVELGLDVTKSGIVAPVWAALLTGDPASQGHGSPSDEIRDASGRVPNLWFGDFEESDPPGQRFHIEVYVSAAEGRRRIAAAVAAGGTIVDSANSPNLTVIADQDGNRGVVCVQ